MPQHPQYLELPWSINWERHTRPSAASSRRLWWLIALLTVLAVFLIGVGVTSGVL